MNSKHSESGAGRKNSLTAHAHGYSVKSIKRKISVPIYDAVVWIIARDGIAKERKKWEHLFGPGPDGHEYDALCSHSGGHTFGLFFERRCISIKIISHEVFHLTHRMMDWAGANFDSNHHEQGALLHGYLMDVIFKTLKK